MTAAQHDRIRFRQLQGMTLIEMLLAIALTLALVGSMFTFYFNVLSSRSKAFEHIRQQQAATTLIGWLDNDLTTCIAGNQWLGAGLKGDATTIRLLSRGVPASLAQHGSDDPQVFSDLQIAEYRLKADQFHIEGRRAPAVAIDSESASKSSISALEFSALDGAVHRLRFRYFDGEEWLNSFDSLQANCLPVAVEVALWLNPMTSADQGGSPDLSPLSGETEVESLPVAESAPDGIEFLPAEEQWPIPDRVRVILIPDAQADISRADKSIVEGR